MTEEKSSPLMALLAKIEKKHPSTYVALKEQPALFLIIPEDQTTPQGQQYYSCNLITGNRRVAQDTLILLPGELEQTLDADIAKLKEKGFPDIRYEIYKTKES